MIVTANSHIGFNCKDLDRTQKFYEDVLGCREKFSLYYGDLIPEEHPERWAQMKPEEVERLKKLRDVRWIVYLEWPGDKDRFIELFNEVDAHVDKEGIQSQFFQYPFQQYMAEQLWMAEAVRAAFVDDKAIFLCWLLGIAVWQERRNQRIACLEGFLQAFDIVGLTIVEAVKGA